MAKIKYRCQYELTVRACIVDVSDPASDKYGYHVYSSGDLFTCVKGVIRSAERWAKEVTGKDFNIIRYQMDRLDFVKFQCDNKASCESVVIDRSRSRVGQEGLDGLYLIFDMMRKQYDAERP